MGIQHLFTHQRVFNLCGTDSALADYVRSRGRKSGILVECTAVGIMSLIQIGTSDINVFQIFVDFKQMPPGTAIGSTVIGPITCQTSCVSCFTFTFSKILTSLFSGLGYLCIFFAAYTIHLAK